MIKKKHADLSGDFAMLLAHRRGFPRAWHPPSLVQLPADRSVSPVLTFWKGAEVKNQTCSPRICVYYHPPLIIQVFVTFFDTYRLLRPGICSINLQVALSPRIWTDFHIFKRFPGEKQVDEIVANPIRLDAMTFEPICVGVGPVNKHIPPSSPWAMKRVRTVRN